MAKVVRGVYAVAMEYLNGIDLARNRCSHWPHGARAACAGRAAADHDPVRDAMDASLAAVQARRAAPQPGDWLAEHKEPGQTYQQFRATGARPRRASSTSTLRLVPIGPLSEGQTAVLESGPAIS